MEWISVEDRLPPVGVWVIASTVSFTEDCDGNSVSERVSVPLWLKDYDKDDGNWFLFHDWPNDVTHWMPLPPPPSHKE